MGPVQAITTCLRKSFTFSGRASRSELWWFAPIGILTTALALSSDQFMSMLSYKLGVLEAIVLVLLIVPFPLIAALVRRFKDAGIWLLFPLTLPVWLIVSPPVAIVVDASSFGLPSMNRGTPEIIYAGLAYLIVAAILLGLALRPSRTPRFLPVTTR